MYLLVAVTCMSGSYRSGLIFPAVASIFPTVVYSSLSCVSLSRLHPAACLSVSFCHSSWMAILDWRRNPVTYHFPCEALDTVGFSTSVGVLLVSGHKITKHMLTTLFSPLLWFQFWSISWPEIFQKGSKRLQKFTSWGHGWTGKTKNRQLFLVVLFLHLRTCI